MADNAPSHKRSLEWWDCSSVVAGIMLGTGIFFVFPALAASHNPSVLMILWTWSLGAIVAWTGAMCFAELATRYPHNGGEYLFLREGFKESRFFSSIPFLFAWAQIFIVRPATLVSLAIVFGLNVMTLIQALTGWLGFNGLELVNPFLLLFSGSTGILVLLTLTNIRGIRFSATLQNILTLLKIAFVVLIIVMGLILALGLEGDTKLTPLVFPAEGRSLWEILKNTAIALIPIMWVFGGWNEAPFIAGEIRNPRKNTPRALAPKHWATRSMSRPNSCRAGWGLAEKSSWPSSSRFRRPVSSMP